MSWTRIFKGFGGPTSRRFGRRGERLAARFLARQGLRIVDRNVRIGRGEIDLVLLDDLETLVFVEVKTRRPTTFSDGFDKIDERKRRVFRSACRSYLAKLTNGPSAWRIDLVLVEMENRPFARPREILWIPHAF